MACVNNPGYFFREPACCQPPAPPRGEQMFSGGDSSCTMELGPSSRSWTGGIK